MQAWYKPFGTLILVGILGLALFSGTVFAQEESSGPGDRPGRPSQHESNGERPDDGLRGIINHDEIKSVIAATLGLTVEELDAAHEAGTTLEALAESAGVTVEDLQVAAKAEAIAQVGQAVADGTITQEEADALIERINSSDFPLGGHGRPDDGHHDGGLRGIIDHEAVKSVIADTLGLTVEELDAAHEAGTTLEELAESAGVTIEDLQIAAKAEAIAQVGQAVADGTVTQAEADALIERINNSDFPLGGRGRPEGSHRPDDGLRGLIEHDAIKSVIATTVGLTVEELDAAHDAGTTLQELAEAQGITVEDVQAAAKAEAIAQINQAVADGTITQEEADALIERIDNSDFPVGGRGRPEGGHHNEIDDDTGIDDNAVDGSGTSTQNNFTVAATIFLPLVTR